MTTRHHGETEAPAEGIEARIEDAFEWVTDHGRQVVIGIGLFLVVGGGLAGLWEMRQRAQERAYEALAAIEGDFSRGMGGQASDTFVVEPANSDQARRARETALTALEGVAAEHSGSMAATIAQLRAAELELDLERLDAAGTRLEALVPALSVDDPVRGIALRLHGFVLEEQGRDVDAANAYAGAGAVTAYPDRGSVWLLAAELYGRAGDRDGELRAFQAILEVDPVLAERERVADRMNAL